MKSPNALLLIFLAGSIAVLRLRADPVPTLPTGGKIAFQSNRNTPAEIYSMNADGSNPTRLTVSTVDVGHPEWSPDGKRIVFDSRSDTSSNIHIMNADGSGRVRLPNHGADNFSPSFSPDGQHIVFVSGRGKGVLNICVMNADGSEQKLLLRPQSVPGTPRFSPDGKQIVVSLDRGGNDQIAVMKADGTGLIFLTNDGNNYEPCFSPDGKRIVWQSSRDDGYEIYVMNADGSAQTQLTNNEFGANKIDNPNAGETEPYFSPDGKQIVFVSGRNRDGEIYVMNADGSAQARLGSQGSEYHPTWAPGFVPAPRVATPPAREKLAR